jgi:hypothetical protein
MFIRVWSLVFGVWSFFKLKSPLKVGEVPRLRSLGHSGFADYVGRLSLEMTMFIRVWGLEF